MQYYAGGGSLNGSVSGGLLKITRPLATKIRLKINKISHIKRSKIEQNILLTMHAIWVH